MQLQLTTDAQNAIYELVLRHRRWTGKQIAEKLNVSEQLVSKVKKKAAFVSLIKVPDKIRKRAYQSMEETADYIDMKIDDLEDQLTQNKEVIVTEGGVAHKKSLALSPTEKSDIILKQINAAKLVNELRVIEEPMKILDWIGDHKNELSEITN